MDPITIAAVGSQVLGPILGNIFSSGDRDRANEALNAAFSEIMSLPDGPNLARPILLAKLHQAGVLTPEVENQINLQSDNIQTLIENPDMRNKQTAQLGALERLAKTGMGAEDVLAMNQLRRRSATDANAKIQQILQQDAMRGQAGSGNAFAARLNAAQNVGNQQSDQGLQIAANAAQARRAAIMQAAGLAGDIRNQDVGTEKFNMENERLRRQFVDQNSMGRENRRVQATNEANRFNIGNQQDTNRYNVGNQNEELRRQRQAEQTMYQNQLDRAGLRAGAQRGQGERFNNNARDTAQNWMNIGTGVGGALNSISNMSNNTPRKSGKTPINYDDFYMNEVD